MSGGFFRGTSADQDTRFSNKQAKLLKSQKFAPELDHLVDMTKVKMDVMRPWIANRVTELLGFEDEVLINFIYGLLDVKEVNGKELQISLTGFMEKNTVKFMRELWTLLLSAQNNASGVPQQFLDAKEEETRKKKVETDRIANEIQKKKEEEARELEQEKIRNMDGAPNNLRDDNTSVWSTAKDQLRGPITRSTDEKELNERISSRGRSRVSRSPPSTNRSPSIHRAASSRSVSRSPAKSRSSSEGSRSRSISRSPQPRGRYTSSERVYRHPSRRFASPRRRYTSSERVYRHLSRRSASPRRRRSPPLSLSPRRRRRRSTSRSRRVSLTPVRHRLHSPGMGRSKSPSRSRSRSPIWRQSRSPKRYRSRSRVRYGSRSSPRHMSPTALRHGERSPVRPRSRIPVRRRSRSPVKQRYPALVRRRSPSLERRRSPSIDHHRSSIRRHSRRSPSTPKRRSLSRAVSRPPNAGHRRSQTPSTRRSPPSKEYSSESPVHHRSTLPIGWKSPEHQAMPVQSCRDRKRDYEKYSPVRDGSSRKNVGHPVETHSEADSLERRNSVLLRSRKTESNKQIDFLRKRSNVSPSPDESLQPVRRVPSEDRSSSPYGSPVQPTREYMIYDASPHPPRRPREHESWCGSPKTGIKVEEETNCASYRDDEDQKINSSGKGVSPSSIDAGKNSLEKFPLKDKLLPERIASHISPETRSKMNYADSIRKDQDKYRKTLISEDKHSLSEYSDKQVGGKRKHRKSRKPKSASDDDYTYDTVIERKETKRRRNEEKKLRKEEKRQRREERRRRREERRAMKRKASSIDTASPVSDLQRNHNEHTVRGESNASDIEETESEQKKLEIELREKALKTLKAKKGINL